MVSRSCSLINPLSELPAPQSEAAKLTLCWDVLMYWISWKFLLPTCWIWWPLVKICSSLKQSSSWARSELAFSFIDVCAAQRAGNPVGMPPPILNSWSLKILSFWWKLIFQAPAIGRVVMLIYWRVPLVNEGLLMTLVVSDDCNFLDNCWFSFGIIQATLIPEYSKLTMANRMNHWACGIEEARILSDVETKTWIRSMFV